MKNLNKKGYMLVEIIVSFSLAFVILISLTNLLLKFKDESVDLFYSTKYLKDKSIITRNIMSDLEKLTISSFNLENNQSLNISYKVEQADGTMTTATKKIKINGNNITYGKFDTDFIISDSSYYTKNIESSLKLEKIENCSNITNKYFCAKIKITSMYNDENYDLTFFSTNVE